MWYIVRVVLCDEYTDTSDASSSQFYGPYRNQQEAERVASSLERQWKSKDYDIYAGVEAVERAGVREIVRRLRASVRGREVATKNPRDRARCRRCGDTVVEVFLAFAGIAGREKVVVTCKGCEAIRYAYTRKKRR